MTFLSVKTSLSLSVLAAVSLTVAGACSDKFADCESHDTCIASGGSEASGGAGDSSGDGGGTGSGGVEAGEGGDTSTGSTVGSGGAVDPCETCTSETPVCIDDACVACSETDTGSCNDDQVCSPENKCVSCLENTDCAEPDASVCDLETNTCTGCEDNESCAHLENTGTLLCDTESASCVACLSADDCGGKVCDPDTHTCTDFSAGTEVACEPCEYDAQCVPGQVCVEMSYSNPTDGIVGSFCLWRMAATELGAPKGSCGLNSQPYAQKSTITTINGETNVDVCRPRTSTCSAILQHATTVTGCAIPGDDDYACGAENFNDGLCRNNSSDQPKCTYPCAGNDDQDCPKGVSCIDDAGGKYCGI